MVVIAEKSHEFQCRLCCSNSLECIASLNGFPKAAQFFIKKDFSNVCEDTPTTLQVFQCRACSLIQLSNTPVSYYKDVITAASLSSASKLRLIAEWRPFVEKYKLTGKKSIEIGAGRGDFLEVMQELNLDASGIENSKENIQFCKRKHLNVSLGYLLSADDKNKYSLVICNNYLEHQPDTGQFIRGLVNLLQDDGVLYISVPNFEYLIAKSCLYEFVADHLVYFTQESLKLACEMNSLEVVESYLKNNGNDIVIVAKKRRLIGIESSLKAVEDITQSLKEYVAGIKKKGETIAIWGAGHRALALMALAEFGELEFVVDSADFKQGLITPLLHKKIISPSEFIKSGCDNLIIMLPGNYAQQVVDYLEAEDMSCNVLIFEDKKIES